MISKSEEVGYQSSWKKWDGKVPGYGAKHRGAPGTAGIRCEAPRVLTKEDVRKANL